MLITALTDIVQGKLQNSPSISFVTQIHTILSKVNEGDAFFATKQEDIQKALEKGAFAIIYDFQTTIEDDEIAWIQVDDLSRAISNILRFNLLQHTIQYIHIDRVFFELLSLFKSKELSYIVILKEKIMLDFEVLNNLTEDKIIFGTNYHFLESIGTNIVSLKNETFEIKNLISHSLFETSFSYKERYFDKLKIPTLYINHLIQQLELFEYKIDLKKLHQFELFKPIFINKSNQIVAFGQTNRFILANKEETIYTIEIEYLKKHYAYANIQIEDVSNSNESKIYELIQNQNFNALYLQGICYKSVIKILEKNSKEATLL